jgi:plastocyanin
LVLIIALAVAGRAERAAQPVQIHVSPSSGFSPSPLTVQRGTLVTWVNEDEGAHTVTSNEGIFASQAIHSDESFCFRFDSPGTYTYFSGFKPGMTGRVIVR